VPAPDQPPPPAAPPVFGENEGVLSRAGHFAVKIEWPAGAKAEEYIKARLTFATGARLKPASVTGIVFDPQMPSMGHGTVTDDQVLTSVGDSGYEFQVAGVYFIMGGPWEIDVTAIVNGQMDTAAVPVEVAP
jgi:hypothetical protein